MNDDSFLASGETQDLDLIAEARENIEASKSGFDKKWIERYRLLKDEIEEIKKGDMNLYNRDASSLTKRIERLHERYQNDKLADDREFLMKQLDHEWASVQAKKNKELSDPAAIARRERDAKEQLWMDMHGKLKAVHEKHGKILYSSRNHKLDVWIAEQRLLQNATKLPEARVKLLEELGILWIQNEDDDADDAKPKAGASGKTSSDNSTAFPFSDADMLEMRREENLFCNLVFADEPGEGDGAEASGYLPHREDGDEVPAAEADDTGFLYGTEKSAASKENVDASETVSGLNASANEMAKAGNDAHSSNA